MNNQQLNHIVKDLQTSVAMGDYMIDGNVYHLAQHLNSGYKLTKEQIKTVLDEILLA